MNKLGYFGTALGLALLASTALVGIKDSPPPPSRPRPPEKGEGHGDTKQPYEPSMDIFGKAQMEQGGTKVGVPTLTAAEFDQASRSTSSAAPAATACCARAPPASR